MIANSYGKAACAFHICAPVSVCARSPVPLSPITRNLTESLPIGGCTSMAADIAGRRRRRRCCPVSGLDHRGEREQDPQ